MQRCIIDIEYCSFHVSEDRNCEGEDLLKFCRAAGSSLLQLLLIRVLKMLFQLSSAVDIALAAAEAVEDCIATRGERDWEPTLTAQGVNTISQSKP